jgi:putative SOS response-associated peptidase YedK
MAPRYNIAPSQQVLGVIQTDGQPPATATHPSEARSSSSEVSRPRPAACWFHWGLIPSWSTDSKGFINARAETLQKKASFREAFRERRCLILADGFYEWKRKGKTKQPYYFQLQDEMPFAFAGIWDQWQRGGATITSCALITTTPNELVAPIHNRMPVILQPDNYQNWLSEPNPTKLNALLVPIPAAEMKGFPVSTAVNRPQVDDASLVERVEEVLLLENGMLF